MKSYKYAVVTPPAEEPITLEDAKDHLRLDWSDDDAYVTRLIATVRQQCETVCGITLITTVYDVYFDGFGNGVLELPRPPLQSVQSVKYSDGQGGLVTIPASAYQVSTVERPGVVYSESWPGLPSGRNSVVVRCTQGYVSRDKVPLPLTQGMLLLIAHLDRFREAGAAIPGARVNEIPYGVESLWFNHRMFA